MCQGEYTALLILIYCTFRVRLLAENIFSKYYKGGRQKTAAEEKKERKGILGKEPRTYFSRTRSVSLRRLSASSRLTHFLESIFFPFPDSTIALSLAKQK